MMHADLGAGHLYINRALLRFAYITFHTITNSKKLDRHGEQRTYFNYLLINDTNCDIKYGQHGTSERQQLRAHSQQPYSWCSFLGARQLHFWFEEGKDINDPIPLDKDGYYCLKLSWSGYQVPVYVEVKVTSSLS